MFALGQSWEGLATVIVVMLLSAISTWFQKRQAKQSGNQNGHEPETKTPPQPSAAPWEEELRKLIGEEPPQPQRRAEPITPIPVPRRVDIVRPAVRPEPEPVRNVPTWATALDTASRLDELAQARLSPEQLLAAQRFAAVAGKRGMANAPKSNLAARLRSPGGIREAVIFSEVLAPPVSLRS